MPCGSASSGGGTYLGRGALGSSGASTPEEPAPSTPEEEQNDNLQS